MPDKVIRVSEDIWKRVLADKAKLEAKTGQPESFNSTIGWYQTLVPEPAPASADGK